MQRIATTFEFVSYQFEAGDKAITFNYRVNFKQQRPINFCEKIELPQAVDRSKIPAGLLDQLLSDIHVMLGISYYKAYLPPAILLRKSMTKDQASYWNTVYTKGLGEFCYRNGIDPKRIAQFPYSTVAVTPKPTVFARTDRSLLGIGGGKDSIVAGELMKEVGLRFDGYLLATGNNFRVIDEVAKTMRVKLRRVDRYIDKQLLEKLPDAYSGHIPISAIWGWLGVLTALVYDYRNVVMGIEHSADYGNHSYKGEEINHQWSKSSEYEALFRRYLASYVTPSIEYFSFLRPFYEIKLVQLLTRYPKYLSVFTSCNRNWKIPNEQKTSRRQARGKPLDSARGKWCGECAKCAYMFLTLAAFLPATKVIKIIGRNMLDDSAQVDTYRDLLGLGKMKPFECVGTFAENQSAWAIAAPKFKSTIVVKALNPKAKKFKFDHQLLKPVKVARVPARFALLGMQKILLAGYAREGKITEQFIHKYYPKLKIKVADEAKDPKAFKRDYPDCDISIKTAGIEPTKMRLPYTTATNLFLGSIKGSGNLTIGITGTKGKSTTASLIAHILSSNGWDAALVGNIGIPMLLELMKPVPASRIYILELSSYQLGDAEYSPNIAIVTNLFPEHMTYHGGVENYYRAKRRIVDQQTPSDFYIYEAATPRLKEWTKFTPARAIAFKPPAKSSVESQLAGAHNLSNIGAALEFAKILGLEEEQIKSAIRTFKPLPHRLELIGTFKGIKFYDDAISTSPESTIAALETIPEVATILLGGQDRGYEFAQLEKTLRKHKVKNIVLFPDSGPKMLRSRKGFNILDTKSMSEAVKFAYENTGKGEAVLLSCASPSYSLWKDFEDKGAEFARFVLKHAKSSI